MRKKLILLVFFLVVLSVSVSARRAENFSAEDAYDWMLQQASDGGYNNDIVDTAAAFLALDAAGGLATAEKEYIVSQKHDNNCWPKAGCKNKDTVWAVLTLHKYGESSYVTDALAWLKKSQTPTLTGGNWWLGIDTPDTGTCVIKYTKGTTEVTKDVDVDAGTFPKCGGGTFFDLKNCLESGLLSSYASLELNIDCSALSSAKISIAYNSGSSYYLYEEVADTTATITVKNGCFGTGYKDPSCSYDSSLYAEWALSQIDSSLSSELYLRESYDSKNTIHNAILYIITQDKSYAGELVKSQKSDGSWDSNSYNTAFAVLALRSGSEYSQYIEKAYEWLKEKQQEDGSWDGKVLNTAMVLYSAFYSGVDLPSCTDGVKNQGERGKDCGGPCELEPFNEDCCDNGVKDDEEEGIDCGGFCEAEHGYDCAEMVCDSDGECNEDAGEDCNNCPGDCQSCDDLCENGQIDTASAEEGPDCGGYCRSCEEIICNNDGKCEYDLTEKYTDWYDNEDSENCADCWCGDDICDDYERESGTCAQDCGAPPAECGDDICSEGEDVSCPSDCEGEACNSDGVCDLEFEDCDCSDCEEEDFCKAESRGRGLLWTFLLIILIALGGGAYFFFIRKKGPGEKPSYSLYGPSAPARREPAKPGTKGSFFARPSQPAPRRPIFGGAKPAEKKSKLDSEIERSIEEAKKLIKGEK